MTRQIWAVVLLMTAVSFFNIVDFMLVMPMGPDFAVAFGAPLDQVPYVGSAYILSAAATAFVTARYLDKYSRKPLLIWILVGLGVSELLAAQSWSFESLLGFRALAGVFGGLTTSLGMAVIADAVPGEFRGRAMGIVGSAFALSSIAGVPFGLILSLWGGWQAPFYVLAGCMFTIAALVAWLLPATTKPKPSVWPGTFNFIKRPKTLMAYGLLASVSGGSFLLIPSFATFMQFNLDFPREQMSWIYLAAGAVTLLAQQVAGWMSDKWSLTATSWVGFCFISISLITGFISDPPLLSVWIFFPLFMISGAMRIVAANTASSLVPEPHERSAHMSLQSGMRHLCSGTAGVLSAWILTTDSSGNLQNIALLATITLIVALAQPLLMRRLEPQLNR